MDLGDKVRDRINGFEGIVTGRAEYLYGCIQVLVAPTRIGPDGKHPDSVWLDEGRVELAVPDVFDQPATAAERAGGPLTNPAPPIR